MLIAVIGLSAALAVTGIACVVLGRRLHRSRRRLAEAEAELARLREPLARSPRALATAGKVVRTMVDTASRVREHGVGPIVLASIDDLTRWALEERSTIRRVAGPDGTVTLLFSDIEGSTSLNSRLGDDAWVALLAEHDGIVRRRVEAHGGQVVKSQGDGFMIVFSAPDAALHAGLSIQRRLQRPRGRQLRRTPVRVRMGVHTGTAIEREGDWFGANVAMAARVAAQAEGGEILVSADVAERCSEDFTLTQTTEDVELKGLPGRHRLWRVEVPAP